MEVQSCILHIGDVRGASFEGTQNPLVVGFRVTYGVGRGTLRVILLSLPKDRVHVVRSQCTNQDPRAYTRGCVASITCFEARRRFRARLNGSCVGQWCAKPCFQRQTMFNVLLSKGLRETGHRHMR